MKASWKLTQVSRHPRGRLIRIIAPHDPDRTTSVLYITPLKNGAGFRVYIDRSFFNTFHYLYNFKKERLVFCTRRHKFAAESEICNLGFVPMKIRFQAGDTCMELLFQTDRTNS